ncbi:DUF4382 domain-containing protein [Solimonas variicoloris]|uniref:DUF4382 domain-containing protein n=1 Tax=Solimonas variicoloris TaxID=254408 RepID=UPI000372DC27|nr:DUF4382 domain-containing protein [Solimonas variicoloris]
MNIRHLVPALAASLLAACGGGGGGLSDAGGTVKVALTDAPACGYEHVYVTVAKVAINREADGSGNWVDTDLPAPKKIDLLSLSNGALESLGQAALPAGTYQQVRLILAPNVAGAATLNNAVVPSGETAEVALRTPSAVQTGIKVNTRSPFTVGNDELVDLVLDFNACKSIVTTGKGKGNPHASGYLLKPVVTAAVQVVSGTIDGYVARAGQSLTLTAGIPVYAEQNGVIIRGTHTDATGHFVLSPLEHSSAVGDYDVVVAAPDSAASIISDVPVTAQTSTVLSTSAAPFVLDPLSVGSGTVSGTANAVAGISLDARQTINGLAYTVATANADSSTGFYSFTLPADAPKYAPYSSTLPIVLAPVATAAGQYRIVATSAAGNTAGADATVTAGGTTTVDFPDLQ